MARVTCEKCGHSMSADWANIANKCPNCKEEVYSQEEEKICPNCYWYKPDKSYSDKIRCINLDRENWHGIEEVNTCKDFIFPCDFKPDAFWSALVGAVDQEIKKRE